MRSQTKFGVSHARMETKKRLFKFSPTFALGLLLLAGSLSVFASANVPAGRPRPAKDWNQDFSLARSSSSRVDALKSALQRHSWRAALVLERAFAQEPRASIRSQMVRVEESLRPQNITFFKNALKDPSVSVREAAIAALGQSQGKRAAADLSALLSSEPDSGARMTIAFWLGSLRGAQATQALAQALAQDKDANVRLQAAQSLLKIHSGSALSALKQAAKDPNRRVRELAR